jgi:hypothetical protein
MRMEAAVARPRRFDIVDGSAVIVPVSETVHN